MFPVRAGTIRVLARETRLTEGLAVMLGETFWEGEGAVVVLGDKPFSRVGAWGLVARGWPAVVAGILPTLALELARDVNVGCWSMREDARRRLKNGLLDVPHDGGVCGGEGCVCFGWYVQIGADEADVRGARCDFGRRGEQGVNLGEEDVGDPRVLLVVPVVPALEGLFCNGRRKSAEHVEYRWTLLWISWEIETEGEVCEYV